MRHRSATGVPAFFIFIATLVGCGKEGPPVDEFEVSGLVTDGDTGARLSGVTISFQSDTLERASTSTDGDGEYALIVEGETLFGQLRAETEGYAPKETTVFFDQPARRVDFRLLPLRE